MCGDVNDINVTNNNTAAKVFFCCSFSHDTVAIASFRTTCQTAEHCNMSLGDDQIEVWIKMTRK